MAKFAHVISATYTSLGRDVRTFVAKENQVAKFAHVISATYTSVGRDVLMSFSVGRDVLSSFALRDVLIDWLNALQ